MKILLTLEEYAKSEKISISAVRKQVASNSHKILTDGKITYIIQDDISIKKLKQNLKNKNGQIRELRLKLKLQTNSNDERYINELIKQIEKLEKKIEKKNSKLDKLQDQKDEMYEKFLHTLVNQKAITT